MQIPSTYTNTWRKTNNILDNDAIEAPAGLEERDPPKKGTSDVSQPSISFL